MIELDRQRNGTTIDVTLHPVMVRGSVSSFIHLVFFCSPKVLENNRINIMFF